MKNFPAFRHADLWSVRTAETIASALISPPRERGSSRPLRYK